MKPASVLVCALAGFFFLTNCDGEDMSKGDKVYGFDDDFRNVKSGREKQGNAYPDMFDPGYSPARWGTQKAVLPSNVVGERGSPVVLLTVGGPQYKAKLRTLIVGAIDASPLVTVTGGPLVAYVSFGNGTARFSMEIDIPFSLQPSPNSFQGTRTKSGFIVLRIPCDYIEVAVGNDANYIPRDFQGTSNNSDTPIGDATTELALPPLASAAIVEDDINSAFLPSKTDYIFSAALATVPAVANYRIPPGARTVKINREPMALVNMDIIGSPNGAFVDTIALPVGIVSPNFDLPANATLLQVDTGAVAITSMSLTFAIGI
jgi:hypothetical protein